MSTLFTMVGRQPGAIASTAKTLMLNDENLQEIILMPSRTTKLEAERLESYLNLLNPSLKVIPRQIETQFPNKLSDDPFPWELINEYTSDKKLSTPIYFDISPGLNYLVALNSYFLKMDDVDVKPIYADYKHLYVLDGSAQWNLENIGFRELLDLHQITADKYPTPSNQTVCNTRITGDHRSVKLKIARERYGRLHGTRDILLDDENADSSAIKQKVRDIVAINKSSQALNNLRIFFQVITNQKRAVKRLAVHNIRTVFLEVHSEGFHSDPTGFIEKIQKYWTEGLETAPGRKAPRDDQNILGLLEKPKELTPGIIKDNRWTGKKLITSLGNDASATLVAAFTHQPTEMIILVDRNTPYVRTIADRIAQMINHFPMKRVVFWPVDIKGEITDKEELEQELIKDMWIANVSPGTKAQAWQVARLPNVELWSLLNQRKAAMPLSQRNANPRHYQLAPILVQAGILQGQPIINDTSPFGESVKISKRSRNESISFDSLIERKDFLINFMRVVAYRTRKHRYGNIVYPDKWKPGSTFPINKKASTGDKFIRCIRVDTAREEIEFEATYNKNKQTGVIHSPPNSGQWLEEPVAAAFMAAGGKNITDARISIKWPWTGDSGSESFARTELDVILIWKSSYLVVSCKSSPPPEKLKRDRTEIMAEAREGFGRFAIPVIVRAGIKKSKAEQIARDSIYREPLEIGMCLLNQSGLLGDLIDEYLSKKQTFP